MICFWSCEECSNVPGPKLKHSFNEKTMMTIMRCCMSCAKLWRATSPGHKPNDDLVPSHYISWNTWWLWSRRSKLKPPSYLSTPRTTVYRLDSKTLLSQVCTYFLSLVKFGLSEKYSIIEKSSWWFVNLLSKHPNHEEDISNFVCFSESPNFTYDIFSCMPWQKVSIRCILLSPSNPQTSSN